MRHSAGRLVPGFAGFIALLGTIGCGDGVRPAEWVASLTETTSEWLGQAVSRAESPAASGELPSLGESEPFAVVADRAGERAATSPARHSASRGEPEPSAPRTYFQYIDERGRVRFVASLGEVPLSGATARAASS